MLPAGQENFRFGKFNKKVLAIYPIVSYIRSAKQRRNYMRKEDPSNVVFTCAEHSMDMYFKVKEYEKKPEAKDFVYVRFVHDDQFESMWVKIHKGTQQQGHGEINNIPVKLLDRKLGDTVSYKTDMEGVTWENKN
jgi:hypothetical protein